MEKPLAFIIEDDARLAMLFVEALRYANYEVEVVDNGRTAQTRLQQIVPDLILLDLHLPYVSGSTLLEQIRADERIKRCTVILTTADAILADALRHEADLVLLKPISFTQLRDLAIRLYPL